MSELEIFTEALTHSDVARTEYLDRACAGNEKLRQRIETLLKQHQSENSFLDWQPQEMVHALADNEDSVGDASGEAASFSLVAFQQFFQPSERSDSMGLLGHYELLTVLGQGGYGMVLKGFDTKLNRLVAIKILAPHLAMTSPARRRFIREARAAAAVQHPNVVQIFAVEETPIPYLVMEFVSGETLQQRSDRIGPFEPDEVVTLGLQIARGLAAAHEQGLIHRDIKPGNILIEDGVELRVKLGDFGLARTADDASASQSGVVVGTPMYMSPEQVRGENLDQRADLFSLGSVLYLMTAGRPPFRAPTTIAVLKRVADDTPRSLHDVIREIPGGLEAVIERLHEKSPNERFATAREVIAAMETCLTTPAAMLRRRAQPRSLSRRIAMTFGVLAAVVLVGFGASEFLGWTHLWNSHRAADQTLLAAMLPDSEEKPG